MRKLKSRIKTATARILAIFQVRYLWQQVSAADRTVSRTNRSLHVGHLLPLSRYSERKLNYGDGATRSRALGPVHRTTTWQRPNKHRLLAHYLANQAAAGR